jgi:hypothetical protein
VKTTLRSIAALTVAVVSAAIGLTGCGDRITANHDWSGIGTASSYQTFVTDPIGRP